MDAKVKSLEKHIKRIEEFVKNGGPEESEYDEFTEIMNDIYYKFQNYQITNEDLNLIYNAFGESLNKHSLHGHGYLQPYGYPGDFEIIDRFYTKTINKDYKKWDNYALSRIGIESLQGRIKSFINSVSSLNNMKYKVLNIASGPCRDIQKFYNQNPESKIKFDCIEYDEKAIEYAKAVLDGFSDRVNFIHKNALRFTTEKKYDLIWSGGLFDYFDDKVFVRLFKRYTTFLKEGAEIIIGNFSPKNPSKAYMELMNWHLNYRDEEHLLRLAEECDLNMDNVWVDSEPLGINLFLHYRNVK
jgi:extracellular factor (EF) 3-hydroxypalmitic acid methyl ester biosynthesis protein